jgi:hypothetical protein
MQLPLLSPETIDKLKRTTLPLSAHPLMRLHEQLTFAEYADRLPAEALIQIVGIRRNISAVAAIALAQKHCSLN